MHNEDSLAVTDVDVPAQDQPSTPPAEAAAPACPRTTARAAAADATPKAAKTAVSQDSSYPSSKDNQDHIEIQVQPEEKHEEHHQTCRICLDPVTSTELQQMSAVRLGCRCGAPALVQLRV
jgi:hypothetical protein